MTGCRRRLDCRDSDGTDNEYRILEAYKMMGTMALWERVKTAVRGDVRWTFWTILLSPLIAGIAEIAAAKSSQQFGREEEKEK